MVKRRSGTRSNQRRTKIHASTDRLFVKNGTALADSPDGTLRNSRETASAPAAHSHQPLSTRRTSAPPAKRRRFRSVIAAVPPKKLFVRFQFSFRASKNTRNRLLG